ncbi:MAG: hypothetical protein MdMp014T_2266 [Treponematales bacterium]
MTDENPSIVYILGNPAYKDENGKPLYKIGTTDDIHRRIKELSSGTSVPSPFFVEYAWKVPDAQKKESALHKACAEFRYNQSREFFQEGAKERSRSIMEAFGYAPLDISGEDFTSPKMRQRKQFAVNNHAEQRKSLSDRGPMIESFTDKCMIIKISKTVHERGVYEGVRRSWRASIERASLADYVLAVDSGVVIGVFKPSVWYPCTEENIQKYGGNVHPEKIAFIGTEADAGTMDRYLNKRVPNYYRNQNPVQYSY